MVSMVEIDEQKLEQLKRDALMYLRRNEDKFIAAAKALSEPKSYYQKQSDWLRKKRDLYGFWDEWIFKYWMFYISEINN